MNADDAMQKAAIYLRVSTKQQTLEQQKEKLIPYAKARGYTVANEWILEEKISGLTDDRPGYKKLMDGARKREIDAIIVYSLTRFGRQTVQLVQDLEELRLLGVQFITYTENFDTSTPMGKAMATIIAAMAQLEVELMKERIALKKESMKRQGKNIGRPKEHKYQTLSDLQQAYDAHKISRSHYYRMKGGFAGASQKFPENSPAPVPRADVKQNADSRNSNSETVRRGAK